MQFTEYKEMIREEYIEDILLPFFPKLMHCREYKGHYYPGYEIGVNIKSGKFLFLWEEGGGVMIGPATSEYSNTQKGWFDLDRIICFVSDQPFIWDNPYHHLPHNEQIITTFHATKSAFIPYVDRIINMVSSIKKVNQWINDYEDYVDKQFKIKYPSYYKQFKEQRRRKFE
jgi:hypothetical protein